MFRRPCTGRENVRIQEKQSVESKYRYREDPMLLVFEVAFVAAAEMGCETEGCLSEQELF